MAPKMRKSKVVSWKISPNEGFKGKIKPKWRIFETMFTKGFFLQF